MLDASSLEVTLPISIEKALTRICKEQFMPPLDVKARRELALLGEEAAMKMLQRFQSLSEYINFMVESSDSFSSKGSVSFSGPHISGRPLFGSPQDDFVVDSLSMEEKRNCTHLSASSSSRNSISTSLKKQNISNSSVLASLGELEFRKAFLILSYSGKYDKDGNKLENLTVNSIRKMKDWPMRQFEAEVWRVMGCKCIKEEERKKNVDWDSGRTYLYQCHVDPDATYTFKGPYLQKQSTHLQKVVGDANVLDVRFSGGVEGDLSITNISDSKYHKIAKEGILVGYKRYQFFVFKDGGKSEKMKNPASSQVKCYFVCLEANPFVDRKWLHTPFNNMSIQEARCVFMHVHMVPSMAKYVSRLSLILSKTVTLEVDLALVKIEEIVDIPCLGPDRNKIYEDGKLLIHTDGTGFISEDLALKCPQNIYKVKDMVQGELERVLNQSEHEMKSSVLAFSKSRSREPPLLIQARLFNNGTAVKGTFLVNKKLPPRTIQVRPSMIKVKTDPSLLNIKSANSFEIVKTSYRPKRTANLSRYLISLLSYGGVPTEFFMELLGNSLEDVCNVHTNKRAALKFSVIHGKLDDFLLTRMILCGIPLDEPYLKSRLSVVMKNENKRLKKGKIPISESYFLMGTADPTGMLKEDQVCVILDHGQVSGDMLVYRYPGLHFGDIHVLTATCVKEMDEFVGNSKYAIFFPTNGPRSLASEIANGDFDGDLYWVSRNPELLASYNACEPWERKYSTTNASKTKPIDFSNEELVEDALIQQFLESRFHPSFTVGSAAHSWLAFMDRLLILGDDCDEEKSCLREKMLHLIDVYYDALDAPKTGKKVEVPIKLKAEKFPHYMKKPNSFRSKSVLGLIYDTVNSFQSAEQPSLDAWKLPCFKEVPSSCIKIWREYYNNYKSEISSALNIVDEDAKNVAADEVYQKYKQILYDAEEFEDSARKKEDIFKEALAIYHISYDVGKPTFAWKVAGHALCTLYASKQDDKGLFVCQKSVLHEILN